MTIIANYTIFLQICAASVTVLGLPAHAVGAELQESKSDLEVSADANNASPATSATVAPAASATTLPTPNGSASVAPAAPPLSAPTSHKEDVKASAVPAAAANLTAPGPTQAAAPAQAAPVAPANTSAAPAVSAVAPAQSKDPGLFQQFGEGLWISGYFQAQYESHQDSDDQLNQSGALLNQDRFVLRRGRVRIGRDWDYASLLVEFDGNTVKGPAFRWQKAEASLVYGRSAEKDVWPLVQFTMGLFDLPFGYELVESPKSRPFMERTTGGRALWPSEPDVGARLMGQVNFFRYTVAVNNGEPLDEKSGFGLQDPNKNKDVTVRLGAITKPWPKVTASGDISYNAGKGFHSGTAATKSSMTWQDLDHNGLVGTNELVGNPAAAATASSNFSRWALGADAQFAIETSMGKSTIYGEVVVAQNLDRGLFVSDPVSNGGQNVRQLSYYIAVIQQVTPYGLVGFRTDYYNPNADFLDSRAGQQIPTSQTIRNYSPLVGFVLPERAKLLFQYDFQTNLLGRDNRGVPAHLPNNSATLRLQVNL